MENSVPEKVNKGGRPISVYWRFDEDGSLKVKEPKKSDYNYYYYKDVASKKVECPLCGRVVIGLNR
jgi:hypothetical protein